MGYMLCSFLGTELKRKGACKHKTIKISDKAGSLSEFVDMYDTVEDGVSILKFVGASEKCDGNKIDFLGDMSPETVGEEYQALRDTPENPIIVVATKEFSVDQAVPTLVRYMPIEGGVLVALLSGYISVMDESGNMVGMSRNYSDTISGISKVFKADDVMNMNILKDMDSGVAYNNHVITECVISSSKAKKDSGVVVKYSFHKNRFTVLDDMPFIKGRKRVEEDFKKKLEAEKLRKQKMAEFEAKQREKALLAEQEEKEKAVTKKKVKKATTKKETEASSADGAAQFLAYVQSLRG